MRPESTFYDGLVEETALWEPLGLLFEDLDVLLCPTVATIGLVAGNSYLDEKVVIDGQVVPHHIMAMMTVPFNVFSRCPVLSVPSGLARNGVPPESRSSVEPTRTRRSFGWVPPSSAPASDSDRTTGGRHSPRERPLR
jgi:hypothetical protein